MAEREAREEVTTRSHIQQSIKRREKEANQDLLQNLAHQRAVVPTQTYVFIFPSFFSLRSFSLLFTSLLSSPLLLHVSHMIFCREESGVKDRDRDDRKLDRTRELERERERHRERQTEGDRDRAWMAPMPEGERDEDQGSRKDARREAEDSTPPMGFGQRMLKGMGYDWRPSSSLEEERKRIEFKGSKPGSLGLGGESERSQTSEIEQATPQDKEAEEEPEESLGIAYGLADKRKRGGRRERKRVLKLTNPEISLREADLRECDEPPEEPKQKRGSGYCGAGFKFDEGTLSPLPSTPLP